MKFASVAVLALMALCSVEARKPPLERKLREKSSKGGKGGKGSGFTLQILHSSDNESNFVDANTLEEKVIFYAALQQMLEMLLDKKDAYTLHLTAGDHTIPGPFYQASTEVPYLGKPGLSDILMFNAMGLDANGIGNHEFDGGIDEFADMLAIANYPFVAANLDFSMAQVSPTAAPIVIAPDAGPCEDAAGAVTKSCYIKLDKDVIVGIIGRAPADFFNVIADPPVTIPGIDFVGGRDPGTNQPLVSAVGQVLEQVDFLEEQGANVIILLDHAQDFTADPLSAESLRGIDIIVAAGSTGFVGQPVPFGPYNLLREGDSADALYPIVRTDMERNPLLVVNSDQLFLYMGHLIVDFDKDGNIVTWDGRSGPIATTEEAVDLLAGILGENYMSDGRKLGKGKGGKGKGSQAEMTLSVRQLLDDLLATPSIQQSFNSVGTTTETLNGLRVDVRTRETNLGRLAADSSIWAAQAFLDANGIAETVDMALKNGGGIRDTIFGPEITELLVESALAFDNKLAIVVLTAEELLATIENSFSRVPAADGRFPQLSGLRVTFDASNPGLEGQVSTSGPSRVVEMAQVDSTGTVVDTIVTGGVLQGDFTRTFVMATNSFLTTGGDGYASLAAAPTIATTTLGEQQILKDYISMELGGSVSIVDPPIPANVINATP